MKQTLARIVHCPPMGMLVFAAVLLGLAPFVPEPHLVEKLRMAAHGELTRPTDIFDLFWHSWPLIWIVLRLLTPAASCRIPESRQ